MLLYFYIIFLLYYIFILILLYGWRKIPESRIEQNSLNGDQFASIVVAVRNEAKNIAKLLASLETQHFHHEQFEVIIVDDQSEDETAKLILDFASKSKMKIFLLSSSVGNGKNLSHKKNALAKGISEAKGDIILTTDGDCWMGSNWLKSMLMPFGNQTTQFVSGPVVMNQGDKLFAKIQSMEFSSLIGSGASLIKLNYPLMCNGANLAFRKSAFIQVGGYEGVDHHASGDDVFLMQKIHDAFPKAVIFNKAPEAIVHTDSVETLRQLIAQRQRWASKWNSYKLPLSWLIPVFLFLHYLSFIGILLGSIFTPSMVQSATILVSLKLILDFVFLNKVMNFCNLRMGIKVFLISEFLYPFYAIIIGTMVHFGSWDWKGRKQKL